MGKSTTVKTTTCGGNLKIIAEHGERYPICGSDHSVLLGCQFSPDSPSVSDSRFSQKPLCLIKRGVAGGFQPPDMKELPASLTYEALSSP